MKKFSKIWIGVPGFLLLAAVAITIGLRADPMKRVVREHGVSVPSNASSIECGGDAWKRSFIDCGAISTFEIPASDLPAFLGILSVRKTSSGAGDTIVPGNLRYDVAATWATPPPDKAYTCTSPTGDFLTVRTWDLPASRVGVLLYTDWN